MIENTEIEDGEIDASDVDWKATAENMQRRITELEQGFAAVPPNTPDVPWDAEIVEHRITDGGLCLVDGPHPRAACSTSPETGTPDLFAALQESLTRREPPPDTAETETPDHV